MRQLLALSRAGPRLFFGFSHSVNVAMGGAPGSKAHAALLEAIRAVPTDRLLVESDVDEEERSAAATALAVRLVADARSWSLEEAAARTAQNGLRFMQVHVGEPRCDEPQESATLDTAARAARGRRGERDRVWLDLRTTCHSAGLGVRAVIHLF